MAASNGLPVIIAGGGIGGLAAAYALALKGIPVRVLEQAPEFREIGAGIQLGPNIFRALEKLGLKDAVLADAHVPPAMEMRDALSGARVTHIPLNTPAFNAKFQQPYAVTHRHDIHAAFLNACRKTISSRSKTTAPSRISTRTPTASPCRCNRASACRGRALIGCDGMWSKVRDKIVGDGQPLVSGHIAYRAVLKQDEVPADLWSPDVILWAGPRTHLVHYPLRRGEIYNLVAVFHSKRYVEGWNAEADAADLWEHFKGQRPEVMRMLERIETWRMWVLCDREPVKEWSKGRVDAARRRRASDAAISRAGRLHGDGRRGLPRRSRGRARRTICRARSGLRESALPAHCARADHGAGLRRLLSRARPRSRTAQPDARRPHAGGILRGHLLALWRRSVISRRGDTTPERRLSRCHFCSAAPVSLAISPCLAVSARK